MMPLMIDLIRNRKPHHELETAKVRMFLTADRSRVVGDGDPDAASLYASPGSRLPDDAVEQFGLVGGNLPVKQAAKGGNKRGKRGENKGK